MVEATMSKEKQIMSREQINTKRLRRAFGLAIASALLGLLFAFASPASAAVQWDVKARWGDTVLQPGGTGEFIIATRNLGTTDAAGSVTLKEHLPPGVTLTGLEGQQGSTDWTCFGTQTVTCTNNLASNSNGRALTLENGGVGYYLSELFIEVAISPDATGTKTNTVTVSGGGGATVSEVDPVSFGSQPTYFGVLPSSFTTSDVYASAFPGTVPGTDLVRQAGDHPYELRVKFDMNLKAGTFNDFFQGPVPYTEPVGRIHDVEATLPRGLIGNPEALPKCQPTDFLNGGLSPYTTTGCPANTQVGYLDLALNLGQMNHGFGIFGDGSFTKIALYNLPAPKGTPVDIGFRAGGLAIGHIYATLDPSKNYAIKSISPDIATLAPVRNVSATIWGVPGDPSHDIYRARQPTEIVNGFPTAGGLPPYGASFDKAPIKPFFTMPMDCGVDNGPVQYRADSWTAIGDFTPTYDGASHANVTGCDDPRIRFNPNLEIQPTSRDASQPTGLDVNLNNPQRDQTLADVSHIGNLYAQNGNLHGIDTPPIKKVVVTLPQGMTISSSAAQGLGSCTPAEIGIGNNDPVTCPDNSQYGTITLHTPILPADAPMHGFIYIAQQNHNPFNNFLSMYFVIEDPERGLRLKIPGKIELDPVTGQITTTFDDLPQFPLSDFQITFKSGVRSALVNPSTCGQKTIRADFYSWADPNTPVPTDSTYNVTQKADGSPCVNSLADRPFNAQMSAGTVNPNAGSYSPFVFRMTRTDDDQEISQIGTGLPPGLTAKLAGISECSDASILAAMNPARTGTEELNNPSCPASSYFGSTQVGSGVGVPLTYLPGKVYLAGPYQGAPLSIVVITPIVAGPYDLGVIAVRTALGLNPETTAAHVQTDPFPQIYQGIPVRIRDIRLKIDRPETIKNPTSCDPMQITAHLTGTGGDVNSTADDTAVDLSNPFQVANCSSLGFKPDFQMKLIGGTHRSANAGILTTLKARPGDANFRSVDVNLSKAYQVDQRHLGNICSETDLKRDECAGKQQVGYTWATTPLLDNGLQGPVYAVSGPGTLLPRLAIILHGQVNVLMRGDTSSVKGALHTSFTSVPDQPIDTFKLRINAGRHGYLVLNKDVCANPTSSGVDFVAQNSKVLSLDVPLQTGCGKAQRHKRHKRHHRRHLHSSRRAQR
jgi:uncharacterized repeat protein (TIGR01451 family)